MISHKAKLALTAFGAFVAWTLFYCASAGTLKETASVSHAYYIDLASSFLSGQLDLLRPVPQGLSYEDLRGTFWDLSYYKDHIYLYWGPVPALILAFIARITGVLFSDHVLTFAFLTVRAVTSAAILVDARKRWFARSPVWITMLGAVAIAFAPPITYFTARAGVYEAALASAQCFLTLGVWAALRTLDAETFTGRRLMLFVVGLCGALAFGSRASHAATAMALVISTVIATTLAGRALRQERTPLRDAFSGLAPVVFAIVLNAYYNYARFESFSDTGLTHQMCDISCFRAGSRFFISNVYSYLFRPMHRIDAFPYFLAAPMHGDDKQVFPTFMPPASDIYLEPVIGIVWSMPIALFAIVALVPALRHVRHALRRGILLAALDTRRFQITWFTLTVLVLSAGAAAPLLIAGGTTLRYMLDFSTMLMLASVIGLHIAYARWTHERVATGLLAATSTAMVGMSLAVSVALWVEGPFAGFLLNHNPALLSEIMKTVTR